MADRTKNPLISVALLCFNHEHFVSEALAGVFAQNYSPLEILIIDDGSKDNTPDIIEVELKKYVHQTDVRFLRHRENKGGEMTNWAALENTRGEFIHLSAGDDIMFPQMIDELAQVWIKDDVSLVTANADYIDDNSKSLDRTFRDPSGPIDDSFETLARDGANACCFAPTMGFARDIYRTFGWPPSTFLNAYDIMLPFYAYLLKGARFINKPLLKYRVHSRNTSLSLLAEKSVAIGRLGIEESIFSGHLNHAILMSEQLEHLTEQNPERFSELGKRILPLLTIQTVEMAKKLVNSRLGLEKARRSTGH